MNENENKKSVVRVTEGSPEDTAGVLQDNTKGKIEKLKKPLILGLMGIVFATCMYLIFNPSADKNEMEGLGMNDSVPESSEDGLQADKQKAYEQELLRQKEQEKQNALSSLAEYWNNDPKQSADSIGFDKEQQYDENPSQPGSNSSISSYRNAQSTLGSFYQDDSGETQALRKQLDKLREKLSEKDIPAAVTVDDQLALMEKSYQMAAKYLPPGINTPEATPVKNTATAASTTSQKASFTAFTPSRKNTISALYREPTDSAFLADWSNTKKHGFYTVSSQQDVIQPKNSIKACVLETQTIIGESTVRLRLLEIAKTPDRTIPKGTILTAAGNFQSGRLQLKVTSIELDGDIIPVDITIYDLDGQQGLSIPYSAEMNALTEMAGNMSQQSGTSLMMTSSAGQQMAADLSRGVVQGISGYFSKKVRTPKVTLKTGHQVFLVAKK